MPMNGSYTASPMDITTRPLSPEEHRLGMADAEAFYRSRGDESVLVAYGWGCDCPDPELYQDRLVPLSRFREFVTAAEAANYYRVSKDNLHFKDTRGSSQFLFCHESDIHFTTDDLPLLEEVVRRWRSLGFNRVPPTV
jgi:hypothetical protein